MNTTRREFIHVTAAGAVGLGLYGTRWSRAPAPLRILILGGTGFIGPHQVEYARAVATR